MRKSILIVLIAALLLSGTPSVFAEDFSDVPAGHWARPYILELQNLQITDGVGEGRFGVGQTVTRAEFAAFLCKLMKWQTGSEQTGSFSDNQDPNAWYFSYVETAVRSGAIIKDTAQFRPLEPITRQEMAVMIVRALGYEEMAVRLAYLGNPFSDVASQTGHITIARDLGIVNGMDDGLFHPLDTATREQAAAMMVRLHDNLTREVAWKNAFYAISSASQMETLPGFDSVGFGWSRMIEENGTVSLVTTDKNGNEYRLPSGYEDPLQKSSGQKLLMAALDVATSRKIIGDSELRKQAVQVLADAVEGLSDSSGTEISFDGVVVDFEGLKGSEAAGNFNQFLTELDAALGGKPMMVAVHPARRQGHEYFDGYDYRTIGEIADKVILMAHDYNAISLTPAEMEQGVVMTPAAPLEEVYYALRAITDPNTGVKDKSKILLQISFDSVQWKLQNGKVINRTPYAPAYSAIAGRIRGGAATRYDAASESPYITFRNDEDGTDNVVWYEDERSVAAKVKLAGQFGVTGVSFWRLGVIPDFGADIYLDVMDQVSGM